VVRKLCESRIVVVASAAYLKNRGVPERPEQLVGHDCIVDTNFRGRDAWQFREGGEPLSLTVASRLFLSSADACVAAAEAGLGITQVPSFVAGSHIRDGRLVPLLTAFEVPPIPVQTIYPPGKHLAAKVRVMVDFLAQRFRDKPVWDQGW
jgi:DNA-binding transcriptional LysR family regulator